MTEDQPDVRAEDVSFALLAVLERLSPLERVVFVLHNAFDLAFDEIAPVARRNAATCRKIFSRARARILQERPRFTVDRERHRALLRGFDQAARSGNTAKLISLLDDDVVFHGDDGGRGFAPREPVVGSIAVANFIVAVTRKQPRDISVDEAELNGTPALMLSVRGRPVVAMLIETDGEHIHSIFAIANPDKLAAIAPPK
jgi:RNA polymerase sigma-70 factor (ECF subfamily)